MKKEIIGPDAFSHEQISMIEMHSFRNIINVLISNIRLVEMALNRENRFPRSTKLLHHFMKSIGSPEEALTFIDSLSSGERIPEVLTEELDEVKKAHPHANPAIWAQSEEIFKGIFDILEVRVLEIRVRRRPVFWTKHSPAEVEKSLKDFFLATAVNSRGKFGIVFPPAIQGEKDYLVSFAIDAGEKGFIQMPDELNDSLRDIAANARKYSTPGTEIRISIRQTPESVTVEVTDQGRGIPEKEIEKVVQLGVRGSNTYPYETQGGGYGLTKAWYVTHHYSGKMWIDSVLHKGTTVTLQIPLIHRD